MCGNHAGEKPLYGHWMIEELRHHGYEIGPGTMYPLLHPNPEDSDLKLRSCFRN
jgi:PadR family transcriptional regulator PadR